jgi:hypothetical protein
VSPDAKPKEWDDDPPIIYEQPGCWAYWNTHGQLVLRQRGEVFEDDPFLIFSVEHIPVLIRTLQQMLEFSKDYVPEPEAETAEPLTSAERQRRYRQRRRGQQ